MSRLGGYISPGPGALGAGAVVSGAIGANTVISGTVGSGAVFGQATAGAFTIASGSIGTFDIGSGAIISGSIASGVVGSFHIASGGVLSGNIASGQLGGFHVSSGAINSGHVGSGAIIGRAGAGSFNIASGSIGTFDLASGLTAELAQNVVPFYSGDIQALRTEEVVSGFRCVHISPSGFIRQAMAAVSGRMPAIGVVIDNVLSGIQANVYSMGILQGSSGLNDFSGYLGARLWVGRSGQVTTLSGSWSSGGFLSGDIGQLIGIVVNSGGGYVNAYPLEWSGGPLGVGAGGVGGLL